MARRYPPKDCKILYGRATGICSFPNCRQNLVAEASDVDGTANIGKIAHIHAHRDDGPRANPDLSEKDRDCYNNWILLCGTHHDLVDAQPNTYTADDLRSWKTKHEAWVHACLVAEMPNVTFAELETVTNAILRIPKDPSGMLVAPDLRAKMKRNDLTAQVEDLMISGLGKSQEVQKFVQFETLRSPHYPERLKAGFVSEYNRLVGEGLDGDYLFEALHDFSYGNHRDFRKQAAGLAVLVYLFQKCEVFG